MTNPAAEQRGIVVLPRNCTRSLIPANVSVTRSEPPQRGGVLNPSARIKKIHLFTLLFQHFDNTAFSISNIVSILSLLEMRLFMSYNQDMKPRKTLPKTAITPYLPYQLLFDKNAWYLHFMTL